jgi:hypothetical protein
VNGRLQLYPLDLAIHVSTSQLAVDLADGFERLLALRQYLRLATPTDDLFCISCVEFVELLPRCLEAFPQRPRRLSLERSVGVVACFEQGHAASFGRG